MYQNLSHENTDIQEVYKNVYERTVDAEHWSSPSGQELLTLLRG